MNIKGLLINEIGEQDLLNYYNANVSYIPLIKDVDGFVFHYSGINNIFINKNLSYYKKRKTLLHELAHIELNQLEQADNDLFAFKRSEYEDEADRYLKMIKDTIKKE